MAQSGQIRQRVNEEQLISLLEQVEQSQGEGQGRASGKITVSMMSSHNNRLFLQSALSLSHLPTDQSQEATLR